AALLRRYLLHAPVALVAARLPEMVARELVVLADGAPIPADPTRRLFAGAIGVLVADDPGRDDRRRRFAPVRLAVCLAVGLDHAGDVLPRLLRDDQQTDAELGHDPRGLGRDRGGVGAAAEALLRSRPDLAADLSDEAPVVFVEAVLEG